MARNAASLALRLRSPRDRPLLPCSIDVLLVCWDTKPVITPGGRLGLNRYEVLLGEGLRGRAEPGHADADRAVLADDCDGLVDAGTVVRAKAGDVAFDAVDELPDDGDLLAGGCRLVACPGVDAGRGGEPFAGAEQVVEVSGQVGEVGHVGAEVVAAGAAEPDRAVVPASSDVGRLGAGSIGDGDGSDRVAGVLVVQQSAGVTPDPVAVPVELHGRDLVDGAAAAVFADPLWRSQISQLSECLSCWDVTGADWRHGWGVAAADFGGVGGPVSGGGALPGDGDRDMDAEHPGEHGGGQVGGELEQCGGAGLAGADADLAEPFGQLLRADGPSGLAAGEQPWR